MPNPGDTPVRLTEGHQARPEPEWVSRQVEGVDAVAHLVGATHAQQVRHRLAARIRCRVQPATAHDERHGNALGAQAFRGVLDPGVPSLGQDDRGPAGRGALEQLPSKRHRLKRATSAEATDGCTSRATSPP